MAQSIFFMYFYFESEIHFFNCGLSGIKERHLAGSLDFQSASQLVSRDWIHLKKSRQYVMNEFSKKHQQYRHTNLIWHRFISQIFKRAIPGRGDGVKVGVCIGCSPVNGVVANEFVASKIFVRSWCYKFVNLIELRESFRIFFRFSFYKK